MNVVVSIIIPCWRQAQYLPVAVGSCLAQTHPDVETIVVDDGSDDDTAAVAASFGPRVRCLSKANGGLASARNAGLAAATGVACLFLDADDALVPEAVAWLAEAHGGDPNALALTGYRTFRDSPAETDGVEHLPAADTEPFPRLIHDSLAPPHAWLASTAKLRSIGGFDPEDRLGCEDWDAWTRLCLAGARLRPVRRVGALYRNTPESMSKQRSFMLRSRATVLLRTHAKMLAEASLRDAFGTDLLAAERRVLRRFHAHRFADAGLTARVRAAMSELEAAGFRDAASPRERVERAVFGAASERVHVAFCRAFRRNWFEFYRSGHV